MTDFETMLNFFSPETDYVYTFCAECGTPLSVNNHATKRLLYHGVYQVNGRIAVAVRYHRFLEVLLALRFLLCLPLAILTQRALDDRDWQRKTNPDGHELSLVDCGAREFIEDGGVELWLRMLGVGVQPSAIKRIKEAE
jgi:hypothetical protein